MATVRKYYLPPTTLIPNSPLPLLHYPGFLNGADDSKARISTMTNLFKRNGWQIQWLVRYGATQRSHYHTGIHECMAVLSGTATIRFGVADTSEDPHENTQGTAREKGGIELQAHAGDVFIIPAGVAHKTYDPLPQTDFLRLTPGDGHEDVATDVEDLFCQQPVDGFTMLGAYPLGHGTWDFAVGGENTGEFDRVWSVKLPQLDPILGESEEGLRGLWKHESEI